MASERDLTVLRDVLAKAWPGGEKITAVTPLLGGHSNETYLLEGIDAVLRLPPESAPLLKGHGVVAQGKIYQALAEDPKAPPTPRILHLCEDAGPLGDPFFVMEKVRGRAVTDYAIPAWFAEASPEERNSVSRQWASAIGEIATLEPLAVLGASKSPEDNAREWRAMAVEADCPALVELYDRLLSRQAPISGPPTPVHGDCKIANLMWDDFELSSVLDWELAYNGEPLSDLGYMIYFFRPEAYSGDPLPSLPGMIDRSEVVKTWEQASGRSAEGWEWYEAAAIGKMAAIIAYGYALATAGHTFDPRWLRWKERLDANIAMMKAMLA